MSDYEYHEHNYTVSRGCFIMAVLLAVLAILVMGLAIVVGLNFDQVLQMIGGL